MGISADATWRRRGYSSSYGVVSGLSLMTGKVLDVEVMSKQCRECGSSGAMDAAGCLATFCGRIWCAIY